MNEIVTYVHRTFAKVPGSARKSEIVSEIITRLEDSANEHMEHGKSREDAVNKAIVDFGDMSELIEELTPPESSVYTPGRNLFFSVIGSLMVIALMVFINMYYTPQTIWFVYPLFGILWWPLSMVFFGRRGGGR